MNISFTTADGRPLSFRVSSDDIPQDRVERTRATLDTLNKTDLLRLGRVIERAHYTRARQASRSKYGRDQRQHGRRAGND